MTGTNDRVRSVASPARLPPNATPEQKLAAYEAFVAEMARKADGTLFLNHDQLDAEVVIAQLFRSAEAEVKILTGRLKDEVYGSDRISSAAMLFARKPNTRLQVLHEEKLALDNRFVARLSPLMGDRMTLTEVGPCEVTHFVVADAMHLRVETDKTHHKAFVAFGETDLGGSLCKLFDEID